eukprot:4736634-Prymnesium_polylepis.1
MIDNGAPLHTEPNVLQELVLPPAEMKSMVAAVTGSSQVSAALPEGTMSDAPWRRAGVRYAANELYIDMMERVDAVIDATTGMLQAAEVRPTFPLAGMQQAGGVRSATHTHIHTRTAAWRTRRAPVVTATHVNTHTGQCGCEPRPDFRR